MKRSGLFAALAASLLLAACAQDIHVEDLPADALVELTFEARMDGTRVLLDGYSLTWAEGDEVALWDGQQVRRLGLVAGAGSPTATFRGEVAASATQFTAVYPYSSAALSGDSLVAAVPSGQKTSGGSMDPSALVMRSEFSKGSVMQFRNEVALLRFMLPSDASRVILFSEGSSLAGEDSEIVSLETDAGGGTVEVAVNPGEYAGLTAFVLAGGTWRGMSSASTLKAAAGTIVSLGVLEPSDKLVPILSVADMTAFLSSCKGSSDPDAVLLTDIVMDGKYSSASDYSGTFNGAAHSIAGLSAPLFLALHGTLKRVQLGGEVSAPSPEYAPLVLDNRGTVSACDAGAAVSYTTKAALSTPIVMGGLVAWNHGTVENCTGDGSLSFSSTSTVSSGAVGGLVGYTEGRIEGCDSAVDITFTALCASAGASVGNISSSGVSTGGIAGAAHTAGGTLVSCTNSGKIDFSFTAIESGATSYPREQIGGIIGSSFGNIESCVNHGSICVRGVTSDRSVDLTHNYLFDVGGISGGAGMQNDTNKANTDILDCSNDGDIELHIDAALSNSPIGGIVGWPNAEKAGITNKVSGCTNSGSITMEGGGKVRIGGIMAGTGNLENCSNSGDIHVLSAYSESCIGGINAFRSRGHYMRSCHNSGDVISDAAIWGVGGLLGCHGAAAGTSCQDCSVDCRVSNATEDRGSTGIVLGVYNKNTTVAITLGTAEQPIDVKGSVSWGGNTVEINQASYLNYLDGSDWYSEVHVINAVCSVAPPEGSYFAEGYVGYSDGAAAAGVSVSDGFRVSVTDASGHYSLLTSSDTRYIYISYPSDAVIAKKIDGRPDFFVKYAYPQSRYDFTLERQAVEDRFLLFALADPQAHYSKRGDQPKADTERFRTESVPAINAHIAEQSLPCYGVTLGDIVYSEGSRNSNPGMSLMRTYCGQISMPVFQTMGNHDFTYFYTSRKLTTDASSSTLFLKAQRSFEDAFGPINLSFNRGDVHVVCMRNIIFDSDTDASSYHCGYTDDQYKWLVQDLANVPKDKMVIICGHIPLLNNTSREHVSDILNLLKQYSSAKIFSGHTHYKRYSANVASSGIAEHIHGAVCGQWWWSNIQGDGCPNGYYVYDISGAAIKDEYFMGINNKMNTRDYQIRVYRGNLKTGGPTAYFQWQNGASTLMINVFNGDSRWTVRVYENGALGGAASLMSYSRKYWDSVTAGTTYSVPTTSNQDWWAIGYHIGVRKRGTSNTSYYTSMFHMYKYTLKNASASVRVEATDGYGNVYSTTEVFDTDLYYPDYMKQGNVN